MQKELSVWLAGEPFGHLNKQEISLMKHSCEVVAFKRKSQVYKSGTKRDCIYVILDGYVQQSRLFGESEKVNVSLLGPGAILGLLSVTNKSTFMLNSMAISDVVVVRVPIQVIDKVLANNIGFLHVITQKLSEQLTLAYRTLTQLGYARVDQRILATLIECGSRFGESGEDFVSLNVPLTRRELSELSHTTVESTIRTLRKWEVAGFVTTQNRRITLNSLNMLVQEVMHKP